MNRLLIVPLLPLVGLATIAAGPPPGAAVPVAKPSLSPPPVVVVPVAKPAVIPKVVPAAKPRRHVVRRTPSHAVATVAAANRSATLEPAQQGFVNAVLVYPYAEGMLYQAYTAPGRITDIALQPGEALVAVASGDTVRWVIGDTTSGTGADKRTHILVKPFASGLATNLVITTDRRSYHLALTSTGGSAMAALSWTYPQDALIALRRAEAQAAAAAPIAEGMQVDQLRFDYAITGDRPAWRPLRAFDDGRQTFIEFPSTLTVGEAPPLFLVDRKGEAQLVNYRLRGRFYVVDRLFDVAELRLGTKHQDVVRISRAVAKKTRRAA
jgi:type IV secretion system protein VirB9